MSNIELSDRLAACEADLAAALDREAGTSDALDAARAARDEARRQTDAMSDTLDRHAARMDAAESALEAATAERDEALNRNATLKRAAYRMTEKRDEQMLRAESAESALAAATETLRQIVGAYDAILEAERDDAKMGYPLPGDSCLAAAMGLYADEVFDKARAFLARTDSGKTGFESLPLLPEDL